MSSPGLQAPTKEQIEIENLDLKLKKMNDLLNNQDIYKRRKAVEITNCIEKENEITKEIEGNLHTVFQTKINWFSKTSALLVILFFIFSMVTIFLLWYYRSTNSTLNTIYNAIFFN